MLFTDKLYEGKVDGQIHKQFVRFSIGTFENRASMKITKSKDFIKLTSSYDLIKDLTKIIGKNTEKLTILTNPEKKVIGKIFYSGKKKEKIEENKEITGEELVSICNKAEFVLLNLTFGDYFLKVGKTLPKPGSALKGNFCKAKLPLKILEEVTTEEFKKKLEVTHTFVIESIEVPKEYEDDSHLARINAVRKGRIIRKIIVDGEEKTKEFPLKV